MENVANRVVQFKNLSLLVAVFIVSTILTTNDSFAQGFEYDSTRIMHAMARARSGEPITIGVLGGSITAGYAASTEDKRWANLVKKWWSDNFPQSQITLINAGIGGTGSDIGTHRVYPDLLQHNPDFIVVEFSVNDSDGPLAKKMMEGLVRQILAFDPYPGLLMLTLKQDNGTTAMPSHKPVAQHYGVPMANFAELIDGLVVSDGVTLSDCFVDGLHPNDIGMQYIADIIAVELNSILNALPSNANLPTVNMLLPEPLVTDTYATTYRYSNSTLVASSNSGWELSTSGWVSETPGSTLSFEVEGNAISILYTQHNTSNRGRAEVWVNDGTPVTLNSYFNETWGPATRFALIAEDLPDGVHTLHIRVLETSSPASNGTMFPVQAVLTAGNLTNRHPIANPGGNAKVLINTPVQLNGMNSFDPDGEAISFNWSVVSAPAGNQASITNSDASLAQFTPDEAGIYRIGLIVSDGTFSSVLRTIRIEAKASNQPPVAIAGENVMVETRTAVNLDGTGSYDPDNEPFTYHWTLISQPEGSSIHLSNPTSSTPRLTPRVEGDYLISLEVNDSIAISEPSYVTVTVVDEIPSSVPTQMDVRLSINLYPNPTCGLLTVYGYSNLNNRLQLNLYSVSGSLLATKSLYVSSFDGFIETLNLKQLGLSQGTYIVELNDGTVSKTKKVVLK
jgi:lysophospholipase L1-like esterase